MTAADLFPFDRRAFEDATGCERCGRHECDGSCDANTRNLGNSGFSSPAPAFQHFPTEELPQPIRRYVESGAQVIGCDESFIALPLLSALAAAVGATHHVELKRGWSEPAIVWSVVVADSGTLKSPALDHAMAPVYAYQREAMAGLIERRETHERDTLRYEKALSDWKRSRAVGDPPEKPEAPIEETYWTSDATVEALGAILADNPRGTLLVRDELSAWLGAFDRYSGGSADPGNWLQMFGGRPLRIHRKTSGNLYVPAASVSICGGIQPGTLQRALGSEHREHGLLARLLVTSPPRRPRQWSEAESETRTEAEVTRVFERLYGPTLSCADGPTLVRLDPEARKRWIAFYNVHGQQMAELEGDLAAAFSKLERYAARLALVVHMAKWGADPSREVLRLDAASVDAGVSLARWFAYEAGRVYRLLSESHEDRERRLLVEWLAGHGGVTTARDLSRGPRRFRGRAEDAEKALIDLVKAGLGRWRVIDHDGPGRQTREFRLAHCGDGDENARTPGNGAFSSPSSEERP